MKKNIKIILSLLAFVPVLFFSGCNEPKSVPYLVNLEIWGVFDSSDVFVEAIAEYKKVNPYVGEIKYKKFSPDTYKTELIDALASGQGPDIFLVQNTWLPSFESKLEASPKGLIGLDKIKENFVDVVQSDFVSEDKVYTLPLSVDSMALYYNKSLFNSAGITAPPKTWAEFNDAATKLTKLDAFGSITQSGAAMGTAYNINRSTDILGLLMLQNGAKMTDDNNKEAKINEGVVGSDGSVVRAGEVALGYYAQFAKKDSPLYTWNNDMHYSLDAFSEGNLAMMLNYSWQIDTIKNKNSKLNFDIAPVPQVSDIDPVSYANYWGWGVSKNKVGTKDGLTGRDLPNEARVHESWQFLKFLTMKNSGVIRLYNAFSGNFKDFPINYDPAAKYIEKTNRPAARRDLIDKQKDDPKLGVFAKGNLIAKNWYQKNPDSIEKIFADAIDYVSKGGGRPYDALSLASNRITEIMSR
ncbi:MAG: hypothetical protein UX75_C0033G0006 [Candidatus Moranbacteria bacterium GW2011_GWE2_47_10]|nr:MAG: hypothetical protein UX75_C0033G0006 [Candidatus Moranbacteria bacterium GW2011_GWE2_47_10]HBP01544.1 hypothetical protein [Candidatus Moranbacteria bacterium]